MIKSMTGYGASSSENNLLFVQVEIKSLNSKYLDLNMRLPKDFSDKEVEVRNLLNNTIERGKVSLTIDVALKTPAKPKVSVNKELVKLYYEDLKSAHAYVGAEPTDLFKLALQMPKAVESDLENEDHAEEWNFIIKTIQEAIAKCTDFRINEGKVLAEKFKEYIASIEDNLKQVETFDPLRIDSIRQRIKQHFEDFGKSEQMDSGRFEQELIFYIEKLDINEEKVRLRSHLNYFLQTMTDKEASGKKLGFIAQEIGREINTIGSKANDANIQKRVVRMKEELEKIKEQSLNIL
ncbi:MAG: YicC/YloC family endoribonuclease [Cytophagaceae bacterium]